MSDTYRVRIVKGADLKAGDQPIGSLRPLNDQDIVYLQHHQADDHPHIVLDETPGVFLEGVTAEDAEVCARLIGTIIPVEPDVLASFNRVRAALRKAAES